VRVTVTDRCAGHGRCYGNAPEVFEYDDAGYSRVKFDGKVPEGQEEAARAAAAGCPESAILIEV
jgi:ferredoxin